MTDSSQPIPASVLDEIERLEKAATSGPWEKAPEGSYPSDEAAKVLGPQKHNRAGHPVRYYAAQFPSEEDAALIVAMRNALPELIRLARIGMKAEGSGWKTIDSAPKDGTEIDLWAKFEKSGWRREPAAHWNAILGDWQLGDYNASDYMVRPEITHWMPLPASPEPGDPT
jgi:hypothetical protein